VIPTRWPVAGRLNGWNPMKYANREMKIDQIIGYFNDNKISLIPPFQRGSVWTLPMRQKLIANMVQQRPIPAIFLYKDPEGSMFSYNILDGKQRLETLILFVGDKHPDLKVNNLRDYFFGRGARKPAKNFQVQVDGKLKSFARLGEALVRSFREYAIPTIEIDMDDDRASSLDELTNLFTDINTYGVKVSRFHVVKAMRKDPLIGSVFDLIAVEQTRRKAKYYKAQDNNFTFVLKRLQIVYRLVDPNSRVDRMWERLVEIALFARVRKHRAPVAILGMFLKGKGKTPESRRLDRTEIASLRSVFGFLAKAYRASGELMKSNLATDQPQFYTLVTSLLGTDLIRKIEEPNLIRKLTELGRVIAGAAAPDDLQRKIEEYKELSTRQTTNPGRRVRRQELLIELVNAL
jgi:hypothetical protein